MSENEVNLIGPCGVFCGSCRHYLVLKKNQLKERGFKRGCEGCRIRNKNCAFIRKSCLFLRKNKYQFCFECDNFPCNNLKKLNNRHKNNYGDEPILNLQKIKEIDVHEWIKSQISLYSCPQCGGEICIHDEECYDCGFEYNPHKI